MTVSASLDQRVGTAAARVLTEVFSPVVLVIGLLLAVGIESSSDPFTGLGWGAAAALFAGVIPYGVVILGVRAGRLTDRHVRIRSQRHIPLVLGVVSVGAGLVILAMAGAPRQLFALVAAMLSGLLVTLLTTLRWKISVHAAVAAGTATILSITWGPLMWPAWVVAAAVGWSRVQLRHHTLPQVLAGLPMGTAVAAVLFATLR